MMMMMMLLLVESLLFEFDFVFDLMMCHQAIPRKKKTCNPLPPPLFGFFDSWNVYATYGIIGWHALYEDRIIMPYGCHLGNHLWPLPFGCNSDYYPYHNQATYVNTATAWWWMMKYQLSWLRLHQCDYWCSDAAPIAIVVEMMLCSNNNDKTHDYAIAPNSMSVKTWWE